MPTTNTIAGMTPDDAYRILRERYINHEIDFELYASLTEDIVRIMERRIK